MKWIVLFFQYFMLVSSSVLAVNASLLAQTWVIAPDMPQPRIYGTAATYNGKIYFFGGSAAPPDTTAAEVFVFDTISMTWSELGQMPEPLGGMSAITWNNKIYLLGGGSTIFGKPNGKTFIFDPTTLSWDTAAIMPTPRSACATGLFQDKIYTVGGLTGNSPTNVVPSDKVEVFDPATKTWDTLTPFPFKIVNAVAATVNGQLFVLGGSRADPLFTGIKNTFRYDPATDDWIALASMTTGRWGAPVAVLQDEIYIIGGASVLGNNLGDVEIFNPSKGSWAVGAPLFAPRRSLSAVALGNEIYAMGGIDYNVGLLTRVEKLTGVVATGEPGIYTKYPFWIAPNPASNSTTLHFRLDRTADVELLLYNIDGTFRYRQASVQLVAGEYEAVVELAGLEAGFYTFMLLLDGRVAGTTIMEVVR